MDNNIKLNKCHNHEVSIIGCDNNILKYSCHFYNKNNDLCLFETHLLLDNLEMQEKEVTVGWNVSTMNNYILSKSYTTIFKNLPIHGEYAKVTVLEENKKEMTLDEIEKQLGYKIKIVNKEK